MKSVWIIYFHCISSGQKCILKRISCLFPNERIANTKNTFTQQALVLNSGFHFEVILQWKRANVEAKWCVGEERRGEGILQLWLFVVQRLLCRCRGVCGCSVRSQQWWDRDLNEFSETHFVQNLRTTRAMFIPDACFCLWFPPGDECRCRVMLWFWRRLRVSSDFQNN